MKLIFAIALILATSAAAESVTVGWRHSALKKDGSPLALSEIKGTNLRFRVGDAPKYGPFLRPVGETTKVLTVGDYETCIQFQTVLNSGVLGAKSKWLCLSAPNQ